MNLNCISRYKSVIISLVALLLISGSVFAQEAERWKLSVNNDRKPLEILMDIGESDLGVTYLFDITRDTLNMSFVAEEALSWKKHGVSVYAMPKGKEVLKLKLDDEDLENVQVVFYRMWKAMPKGFKNVTSLFELREYGVTESGKKVDNFIIKFKMKRPRRGQSISF
ncbi:hypothetical protein DF185_11615 [Marinifilum breve]|uniref:Uncharacterized protein n=1 Tax=Marinifilum breve TaxID=2184082 RepID=A0A2V4ABB9_9BACT|nr:hypothetical protein [Marinifilum breve]PXY01284.1 hypothetical protein DF185_11615 [Marinifilum breve]